MVSAAVIVSPWLYGSAEPWAYLSVCILVNLGTAAWCLSLLGAPWHSRQGRALRLAAACLVALLLVQMMPLPTPLVRVLNPVAAEARTTANAILDQLEGGGSGDTSPGAVTLSVAPLATRRSLFLLIAYLGVFFVISNTVRDWRELRALGIAVVVSGFAMAITAMIQGVFGARAIYGFYRSRLGGTPFGCFTNRNHFAAYMNLVIGLALGLLPVRRHADRRAPVPRGRREPDAPWSPQEIARIMLLLFAAAIMGASVCLSLSRGGMTSLALALAVMGSYFTFRTRAAERRNTVLTLSLFVAAVVIWLGWEPVADRLGTLIQTTDPLRDTRTLATLATLRAWGAAPLAGCGFGAFRYFFPMFQPAPLQIGRFLHAHNDYAQLLAEGGLLGAALAAWFGWRLVRDVRACLPGASRKARRLLEGLSVGFIAIGLHSFVDFSLHKPAVACLLAFLCGMAIAAFHLPRSGERRAVMIGSALDIQPAPWRQRLIALAGLAVCLTLTGLELSEVRGELAFARLVRDQQIAGKAADVTDRNAALRFSSYDARSVAILARSNADILMDVASSCLWRVGQSDLEPDLRIRMADIARHSAVNAVQAAPSDYEGWLWLARAENILGRARNASLCLGRARDLAPPGMRVE